MIIYLDFDGTCVEHAYPNLGRYNPGCIEVIKECQDAGHEIILNTYRADIGLESLQVALNWLNQNYWMFTINSELILKPINRYEPKKIYPNAWKLHPDDIYLNIINNSIYIDDIAANIPLKLAPMEQNQMVDWEKIKIDLKNNKII